MSQLDFYGTTEDILNVIEYMFSIADMKLYESYSAVDSEIIHFNSAEEIVESAHLRSHFKRIGVTGWWTSVTKAPHIKKYQLEKNAGNFRYKCEGVGTFRINQEGLDSLNKSMRRTTIIHWNEAGAKQNALCSDESLAEVNWQEFKRLSSKVGRHMKNKMAVAKLRNVPILTGALGYLVNGGMLWGYPGLYGINSDEIWQKDS